MNTAFLHIQKQVKNTVYTETYMLAVGMLDYQHYVKKMLFLLWLISQRVLGPFLSFRFFWYMHMWWQTLSFILYFAVAVIVFLILFYFFVVNVVIM